MLPLAEAAPDFTLMAHDMAMAIVRTIW